MMRAMLPQRATLVACVLLAFFALADLTVVVVALVAPHQRYRAVIAWLFAVLALVIGMLAWKVWRRIRWAYWLTLAAAVVILPAAVTAVGRKSGAAALLAADVLLLLALAFAYREFRRESAPLYLTPTGR